MNIKTGPLALPGIDFDPGILYFTGNGITLDLITILGIAVSLAMDAFSVCIAAGVVIRRPTLRHYFRLSFHFGLFQFFMPIIGYFGGMLLEKWIRDFDHWVAFGLLSLVGLKMIRESMGDREGEEAGRDPSRGMTLVVLSVATSIDAIAVGFSFGVMGTEILMPSIVIGVVCTLLSITGIAIGKRVGMMGGKWVERMGGIVLIAIGVKILLEHIGG